MTSSKLVGSTLGWHSDTSPELEVVFFQCGGMVQPSGIARRTPRIVALAWRSGLWRYHSRLQRRLTRRGRRRYRAGTPRLARRWPASTVDLLGRLFGCLRPIRVADRGRSIPTHIGHGRGGERQAQQQLSSVRLTHYTGRPRRPFVSEINRRRPTLPGPCGPSTIGAEGLNCSVRNGKRCFPLAKATGKRRETASSRSFKTTQRHGHNVVSKKSVKPSTH